MGDGVRNIVLEICVLLLAALFFYTGISKLIDAEQTYYSLKNQVFADWVVNLIYYSLPPMELITAVFLVIPPLRGLGIKLSILFMTAFTLYIGIVMTGVFGRIPCSCGGVISKLSWGAHLLFNIVFLTISISAFFLVKKKRKTQNSHLLKIK